MNWNGRVCAKLGMRAEHTVNFEEVKEKNFSEMQLLISLGNGSYWIEKHQVLSFSEKKVVWLDALGLRKDLCRHFSKDESMVTFCPELCDLSWFPEASGRHSITSPESVWLQHTTHLSLQARVLHQTHGVSICVGFSLSMPTQQWKEDYCSIWVCAC